MRTPALSVTGARAIELLRREGPVLAAVTASWLAALALFGVGDIGHGYWAMARDYWNPRFDFYIRETLLFPAYLRALDAVGIRPGPAGNLAVVWLTAWGLALALRPRVGRARAALLGCALPLSSAGLILFAWAGMPDFLTVLLTAVACFARRPAWLAVAGFLGAANHLSQFGFIALSVTLLRGASEPSFGRREGAALLASAALGALLVRVSLWAFGIEPGADRLALALSRSPLAWWSIFAGHGWLATYTFHHGQWLLVAALALALGLRRRRALGLLLACELLAFVPAVLTQDTTRVFALLSWFVPLVLLVQVWEGSLAVPRAWPRGLGAALAASLALTALLPALYVWHGEVYDTSEARRRARELLALPAAPAQSQRSPPPPGPW